MHFLSSVVLPLWVLSCLLALVVELNGLKLATRRLMFAGLAAAWIVLTIFRPWGASPDDWNYVVHLRITYPLDEAEFTNRLGHSPLYYFLLSAVRVLQDGHWAFFIIAAGALAIKFFVIGRMMSYNLTSLFAYVSIFWMLHDVVQLRTGVAAVFLLLALYAWGANRKPWSISAAVVAPFIHISGLISLAGVAVQWAFARRYWLAFVLVVVTQAMAGIGLTPPSSIIGLVGISNERATSTLESATDAGGLRLSYAAIVLMLAFAIPGLEKAKDEKLDLAFFSVVAAFFVYWLTAEVGTVSSRLLQFLSIPIVLLAPAFRFNAMTYSAFIAICAAYFYLLGWINGLMGFGGKWGAIPLP